MAIYNDLNYISSYEKIGNFKDVCRACANAKLQELSATGEFVSISDVNNLLEGQLENKRIIYVKQSGSDICLCLECVEKAIENAKVIK